MNFSYDLAKHPAKDTVRMMTLLLEKVIHANDLIQATHSEHRRKSITHIASTCFHARSVPSISIHAYLTRILKYCPCANECFLAVLVYFDRMSKPTSARPGLRIDSYNIHRLLISGVMIASKLYSDVFFTNTRYAKVGGLPVSELNVLEVEFLMLNEFSLFVTLEELQDYGDQLLSLWTKEHIEQGILSDDDDALTGPIRRRARNLSIDKHADESHDRVYKKTVV